MVFGLATVNLLRSSDSDDIVLPDKIATKSAFLDSHPDVDMVFGNCLYMDDRGNDIPGFTVYSRTRWDGDASLRALIRRNFIAVNAPLIRRSILDRVGGFDPSVRPEDYDLWLRIAATGSIAGTQDLVGKVRRASDTRRSQGLSIARGHIALLRKFNAQFPCCARQHDDLLRQKMSQATLVMGILLHDQGRRREAFAAFRSALSSYLSNLHAYVPIGLLVLTSRQVLALSKFNTQHCSRMSKQIGRAIQ